MITLLVIAWAVFLVALVRAWWRTRHIYAFLAVARQVKAVRRLL